MRLKAYTAATIAEAMQQIREELGDDAVIVATESANGAVRVVAAFDEAETAPPARPPTARPNSGGVTAPSAAKPSAARTANGSSVLARVFEHHGVPETIAAGLLGNGTAGTSPVAGLAERMKATFRFDNLADRKETAPILLAGPPGVGKTLAAAKLAARAILKAQPARLITTDVDSAGAVEQLTVFTRALDMQLETADGPAALARVLAQRPGGVRPLTIIDTRGVNPFDAVEMAGLSALIVASRADPALVLAAGADARESAEMAEAFADIGCTRLIATRLDIARRLGGWLTAAIAGRLALAETGASPIVAHGLQPLNAHLLAKFFANDAHA